jgi:hypothetical protein
MDTARGNPESNILGSGLTETQLTEAITSSGYPLQTVVAQLLRSKFFIQEEWAFADATTSTVRALDLFAECRYVTESNHYRVRPTLNLLVECKQSESPYVFFQSVPHWLSQFPLIAGMHSDELKITTDDDRSTWSFGVIGALDLQDDPFLKMRPTSATFSKCVRQGKKTDLSGADPYNSLVMPLIGALSDFRKRCAPPETAVFFDTRIVLGVGVLDAPMVIADVTEGGVRLIMTPWVRLVRNVPELRPSHFRNHMGESLAIDIVHKDFFARYLADHVQPFMRRFQERAEKHDRELAEGVAFATGMGRNSWTRVEERLRPIGVAAPTPPIRVHRGLKGLSQSVGLLQQHASTTLRNLWHRARLL